MSQYNLLFILIYIISISNVLKQIKLLSIHIFIFKILLNNYVTIQLFLNEGQLFIRIVCIIKYGMGSMDN